MQKNQPFSSIFVNNMMFGPGKTKFLFTLLLIYLLFVLAHSNCQQCLQLPQTNCTVCIDECGDQFFQSCSKFKCSSATNGSEYCSEFLQVSYTSDECLHECCYGYSANTQINSQNIDECYAEQTGLSVISIVIIVLCSLCCVSCGLYKTYLQLGGNSQNICCCCPRISCKDYLCCCPSSSQVEKNSNSTQQMKVKSVQEVFQVDEKLNIQKCIICLLQQVDCVTRCGHYYHLNCFIEWNKRSKKCPLCMSSDFNSVKFYCMSCKKTCDLFYINVYTSYKEILSTIKKKCKLCK